MPKIGIKILAYLDDGFGSHNSMNEIQTISIHARNELLRLGHLIGKS